MSNIIKFPIDTSRLSPSEYDNYKTLLEDLASDTRDLEEIEMELAESEYDIEVVHIDMVDLDLPFSPLTVNTWDLNMVEEESGKLGLPDKHMNDPISASQQQATIDRINAKIRKSKFNGLSIVK
jgi:hypothetical protein